MNIAVTPLTGDAAASAGPVLIALLTFLALLVQKEIVGSLSGPRAQRLNQILTTVLLPLGLVVALVVAMRLAQAFL